MTITFRRFDTPDLEDVARVFAETLNYLLIQSGCPPYVDLDDEEAWANAWNHERRPIFEHLCRHNSECWLAEDQDGIAGYARSILRDDVCQLTEFFVLPGRHSSGIGKELLHRAFSSVEASKRIIPSTTHPSAMARYLKAGVTPVCPICDLEKSPESLDFQTDLTFETIEPTPEVFEQLNEIDLSTIGYRRPEEHAWLADQRIGFLYRRNGEAVGYGYVGHWSGPFALKDGADFPTVLAHAENELAGSGEPFTIMVPMHNKDALSYALDRGFRFDESFLMLFMADHTPPGLNRYIGSMPGFFT